MTDLDEIKRTTKSFGNSPKADRAWQRQFDSRYYLTESEFLTKVEAGKIVSLDPKTIEREIRRGKLEAFKLAGQIRIRKADLDTYIEAGRVQPSIHEV